MSSFKSLIEKSLSTNQVKKAVLLPVKTREKLRNISKEYGIFYSEFCRLILLDFLLTGKEIKPLMMQNGEKLLQQHFYLPKELERKAEKEREKLGVKNFSEFFRGVLNVFMDGETGEIREQCGNCAFFKKRVRSSENKNLFTYPNQRKDGFCTHPQWERDVERKRFNTVKYMTVLKNNSCYRFQPRKKRRLKGKDR